MDGHQLVNPPVQGVDQEGAGMRAALVKAHTETEVQIEQAVDRVGDNSSGMEAVVNGNNSRIIPDHHHPMVALIRTE